MLTDPFALLYFCVERDMMTAVGLYSLLFRSEMNALSRRELLFKISPQWLCQYAVRPTLVAPPCRQFK